MAPQHPMLKQDQASHWMGIRLLTVEPGHAIIEMDIRDEMVNGFGMVHGGMTFAFADTAFALACNSSDPEELDQSITVGTGVDINYLAPAYRGQTLQAEATLTHRTGRTCLVDVTVTCKQKLIAEFRGRGRSITPPAPTTEGHPA